MRMPLRVNAVRARDILYAERGLRHRAPSSSYGDRPDSRGDGVPAVFVGPKEAKY
jgi:hypothetical protein